MKGQSLLNSVIERAAAYLSSLGRRRADSALYDVVVADRRRSELTTFMPDHVTRKLMSMPVLSAPSP